MCAPLTLLTGINVTGKSSVLQALVLLRKPLNSALWTTVGFSAKGRALISRSSVRNLARGRVQDSF